MNLCILLATLLCAITSCVGLPDGAPLSTCSTLLPHHTDNKPQQGRSPYTVSSEKIGSNKVRVTISSPTGDSFRGFILQARSAKDKSKFIAGEFKSSEVAKAIDCHNQKQSTLTHQDRELKTDVITEWTATPNEDVIFRATVVKSFEEYWQNTDSEPVKFSADVEMVMEPSKDSNDHSEYEGCFKSKGCFGMPHRCVENLNCDVLFTYEEKSGDLQFAMHGSLSSSEYMAMGLSEDSKMGDDLVTECFRDESDGIKLRNSWNEGQSNTRTKEANFDHLRVENGRTTCIWTELNVTYFDDRTFDLFNDKYYILLARGSVSNEKLGYHHTSKLASPESVNFYVVDSIEKHDVSAEPRYESTDERRGESTTASWTTADGGKGSNSCSQLISSLLWLTFLGVYVGSRNMV